ncbi:MAG: LacI family transcriptional regulator [Gammaproteobacteria bacterium]|nr:LacI family transcriptional regulator [Gammaproteobacteria bacterium]
MAGVSTATVSRVLNGSARVSAQTQKAVLEAVAQSDYRPNAAAKALATKRTHTIAAVIPTLEHSIFATFMNALEDQLALSGYSLVIATHRFDYDTEIRRCNEVLKLGAEAIIVSGAEHLPELHQLLRSASVPCLYTSVYAPESEVVSIGYDNLRLGKKAIEYLASLGHQNITVLHAPLHNNDRMRLRVRGVQQAEKGLDELNIDYVESPFGIEAGVQLVQRWIDTHKLPDACLCLADVFALGVLLEAQRLELKVPEQVSLMGFENVDWAEHCSPRLTTIALPSVEMGKAVAHALVSHLDDGAALEHTDFDASIIERQSTQIHPRHQR